MKLRKTTSLTTLLSFILLVATSVVLYIAPFGRRSGQWEWLGLGKGAWQALHVNLGLLFFTAGIIHTALNLRPILRYMARRDRKLQVVTLDFSLALLLTAWMTAGTICGWPPVNRIQQYRQGLKHSLDRPGHRGKEAPAPSALPDRPPFRFGSRPLAYFCEEYGMTADETVRELDRLGIHSRADWTLKEIAEQNSMQPHSVYDALVQLSSRQP